MNIQENIGNLFIIIIIEYSIMNHQLISPERVHLHIWLLTFIYVMDT